MTPSPAKLRRLPYHTDEDMLRLEARRSIHAGMLPSNAGQVATDGLTGAAWTPEQADRAWTAQQPWHHVDCPVSHVCVLCGRTIDPDYLRDHAGKCRVALAIWS